MRLAGWRVRPPQERSFRHRTRIPVATSIFGAFVAVGLKLQPGKRAFDILLIDPVERLPSEN